MTLLLTLLACGTNVAPTSPPADSPVAAKVDANAGTPAQAADGAPSDWKKVEKTEGKVPLAERPTPTGPTGEALLAAVRGRVYTSSAMTFAFDDENVSITWPRMKGEPIVAGLGLEGDLLAIEIGDKRNTLNRRLLVEGTSACTITAVHRDQRGLGESNMELAFTQTKPDCTE